MARRGLGLSAESEALLRSETIEARLDEHIVLRDLDQQPEALWSFLLSAGYLKPATPARRTRPPLRLPGHPQPRDPPRLRGPLPGLAPARLAGSAPRRRPGDRLVDRRREHPGSAPGAPALERPLLPGPSRPRP
ncbi:uncharacterized protein CMC5_084900 [Chondromyces crocatus]|uniref:Uncharacterized protein n=1 Tax=Chondromyces crocatus TaxID=52 RepID=A0A0K1ENA3_CHOCO|nr:uncharacterized protein CMC5_084900 [Chondromyces crocatus]